jgi:hypothetical protein
MNAQRAYSSDFDQPREPGPFLKPVFLARVSRALDMIAQIRRRTPNVVTVRLWTLSSRRRLCSFPTEDYKGLSDARHRRCEAQERVGDRRERGRFLQSRCQGGSVLAAVAGRLHHSAAATYRAIVVMTARVCAGGRRWWKCRELRPRIHGSVGGTGAGVIESWGRRVSVTVDVVAR